MHANMNAFSVTLDKQIINTFRPRKKMADILQTTFPNKFPGMKNFDIQIKFHRNIYLKV